MIIVKALLGLAVIFGGGYLGMIYASRFETRVRQLEAFRAALGQLEFNIRFLRQPLAEALEQAAASQTGVIRRILSDAAKELAQRKGARVSQIWRQSVQKHKDRLCLEEQDYTALFSFADSLGAGDAEREIGNIQAAQMRLKVSEEGARGVVQKNCRLYRGLGLLAGMFVAVLLF